MLLPVSIEPLLLCVCRKLECHRHVPEAQCKRAIMVPIHRLVVVWLTFGSMEQKGPKAPGIKIHLAQETLIGPVSSIPHPVTTRPPASLLCF